LSVEPTGELIALPEIPSWFRGHPRKRKQGGEGKGQEMRGMEREGRERDERGSWTPPDFQMD